MTGSPLDIRGFKLFKTALDAEQQAAMAEDIRSVVAAAPLFSPQTPYGKPMSVRMTSAGQYGWYADRSGYRYVATHPNGQAWPDIPGSVLRVWDEVTGLMRRPDCCLINYYSSEARMGMHRDCDEADFGFPVLSISLGDEGLFRIGNQTRGGKTASVWLQSGDVVLMGGAARLTYHGLDRTRPGTSSLLKNGGRINLTLRVVE